MHSHQQFDTTNESKHAAKEKAKLRFPKDQIEYLNRENIITKQTEHLYMVERPHNVCITTFTNQCISHAVFALVANENIKHS